MNGSFLIFEECYEDFCDSEDEEDAFDSDDLDTDLDIEDSSLLPGG